MQVRYGKDVVDRIASWLQDEEATVPQACHATPPLTFNHGHSRGIESARDLGVRTLQQAGKCPPKQ